MLVENATITIALAACILHSGKLVIKVCRFEVFTMDAASGVASHHYSRRRDDRQRHRGKDDANQFQSMLVCHRKTQRKAEKTRLVFQLGLSSLS